MKYLLQVSRILLVCREISQHWSVLPDAWMFRFSIIAPPNFGLFPFGQEVCVNIQLPISNGYSQASDYRSSSFCHQFRPEIFIADPRWGEENDFLSFSFRATGVYDVLKLEYRGLWKSLKILRL